MERELCLPLPWLILSPCYSFRNIKRAHLFVSPFHILLPLHSHLSSTSIPISYLHPTPSVHFFPKGTVFPTFTASFSFGSIGSTCCFSGMERFFGGNADLSGNSQSTDCFLSLNWEGQPDVRFSMGETVGHGHHHTQGKRNLLISRNPQLPPPTIGPLQLAADAGLSCVGSGGDSCGFLGKVFIPEAGRSLMVSTNDVLGISRSPIPDGGESRDVRREFRNAGGRIDPHVTSESSERKRKATYTGKMGGFPISPVSDDHRKVGTEDDSNVKRNKLDKNVHMDEIKPDVEQNGGRRAGKEDDSKTSDPSKKDYIHVRARRGQATDSHSLAERVRREKISERMKFLQDLVPGCNKVTGKAVMLDEIINYVQSLQQQVEFLSMKLATVNPQVDFNLEDLLQKQIQQLRSSLPSQSAYPMDCPSLPFSFSLQPSPSENIQSSSTNAMESHCYLNPLERNLRQTINMQLQTVEGFGDASSQVRSSWEDDLHSVVQMGLMQKQEANSSLQPHNVAGIMAMIHKKLEP